MQTVLIESEEDIVEVRSVIRQLANELGASIVDKTRLATAVGELARNTIVYGGGGEMHFDAVSRDDQQGILCRFVDKGPGIPDIELAMSDGFSTGSSLGQGLPGSKRLVDEFRIESAVGEGTQIEIVRWL